MPFPKFIFDIAFMCRLTVRSADVDWALSSLTRPTLSDEQEIQTLYYNFTQVCCSTYFPDTLCNCINIYVYLHDQRVSTVLSLLCAQFPVFFTFTIVWVQILWFCRFYSLIPPVTCRSFYLPFLLRAPF